jgi:single-stranded-DNA-specific exonuclease
MKDLAAGAAATGRPWVLPSVCDHTVQHLMTACGLPEFLARLLVGRGVRADEVSAFLDPSVARLMPDPFHLTDMDAAVQRLVQAVEQGEQITLWGDYDVDGATSTALLFRFLKHWTPCVNFYIPDRFREGYGPNLPGFRKLVGEGTRVIVTLDCGTTAFEPVDWARKAGVDVIVVDHHGAEPGKPLPPALALVNPNRPGETGPLGALAAVGVTFMLLVALRKVLRERGLETRCGPCPSLVEALDLVALGTVCDVVPLVGLNRAFVRQGLQVLAQTRNTGLQALVRQSGLEQASRASHCGFALGPRVNAGGRIGDPDLGARLLTTSCDDEANQLAQRLDELNRQRQGIEQAMVAEALAQVASSPVSVAGPVVLIAGEGWHEGVIGVVAGRLKEQLHKPVLVIAWSENGTGKGSGRSVPGVDLGQIIRRAVEAGLLVTGGGHPMAAGFSLQKERFPAFGLWIKGCVMEGAAEAGGLPPLELDAAVPAHTLGLDMLDILDRLEPFGAGHPQPRFLVRNLRIRYAGVVGHNHVRCVLTPLSGGGSDLQAVAFRSRHTPLGEALLGSLRMVPAVAVVGTVQRNVWQNRTTLQMTLDDAAPDTAF